MSAPARVALVGALLAVGCHADDPARVAGRLWVSELPTSPRRDFTAFATVRQAGGGFLGTIHRGSAYAGRYQVFRWHPEGPRRARVTLLQTGAVDLVTWRPCEPVRPFDACLELTAGPLGRGRYYSRATWKTLTADQASGETPPPAAFAPLLARARAAAETPTAGPARE